jgi:hypothetical protein
MPKLNPGVPTVTTVTTSGNVVVTGGRPVKLLCFEQLLDSVTSATTLTNKRVSLLSFSTTPGGAILEPFRVVVPSFREPSFPFGLVTVVTPVTRTSIVLKMRGIAFRVAVTTPDSPVVAVVTADHERPGRALASTLTQTGRCRRRRPHGSMRCRLQVVFEGGVPTAHNPRRRDRTSRLATEQPAAVRMPSCLTPDQPTATPSASTSSHLSPAAPVPVCRHAVATGRRPRQLRPGAAPRRSYPPQPGALCRVGLRATQRGPGRSI